VKRKITFKDSAVADLDAIYWHGVQTWGRQRARTYLEALENLFGLLAVQPEIARERNELDPPVRLHPYRSHLVIFTADATEVDILRVVHSRSNWQAELKQ
jgi:toxin ParE1/3/4